MAENSIVFTVYLNAKDNWSAELKRFTDTIAGTEAKLAQVKSTAFDSFSRAQIQPQIDALEGQKRAQLDAKAQVETLASTVPAQPFSVQELINQTTGASRVVQEYNGEWENVNRTILSAAASARTLKTSLSAAAYSDALQRDFSSPITSNPALAQQMETSATMRTLPINKAIDAEQKYRKEVATTITATNSFLDTQAAKRSQLEQKGFAEAAAEIEKEKKLRQRQVEEEGNLIIQNAARKDAAERAAAEKAKQTFADLQFARYRAVSATEETTGFITGREINQLPGRQQFQKWEGERQAAETFRSGSGSSSFGRWFSGINRQGALEAQAAVVNSIQALSSGMNPLHVAMMESTQLGGAALQGGLISLKSIFDAILSPIGIATTAFAAMGIALAATAIKAAQAEMAISGAARSIQLLGQGATEGGSRKEISGEYFRVMREYNTSSSTANTIIGSLNSAAPEVPQYRKRVDDLIQSYAASQKVSITDSAKMFSSAAEGGAKGFTDLAAKIGAIDPVRQKEIERLIATGERGKAVDEVLTSMQARFGDAGSAAAHAAQNHLGLVKVLETGNNPIAYTTQLFTHLTDELFGFNKIDQTKVAPETPPAIRAGQTTALELTPEIDKQQTAKIQFDALKSAEAAIYKQVEATTGEGFGLAPTPEQAGNLNLVQQGQKNLAATPKAISQADQEAHQIKMAQLDREMAQLETVARNDSSQRQRVADKAKEIADEITAYEDKSIDARINGANRENARKIQGQQQYEDRIRQIARANLETQLQQSSLERAQIGPAHTIEQRAAVGREQEILAAAKPASTESEQISKQIEALNLDRQIRTENEEIAKSHLQVSLAAAEYGENLQEIVRLQGDINQLTQTSPDSSRVQKAQAELQYVQQIYQFQQRLLNLDLQRSSLERAKHPEDLQAQLTAGQAELALLESRGAGESRLIEKRKENIGIERSIALQNENITISQLKQNLAIAQAKGQWEEVLKIQKQIQSVIENSPVRGPLEKKEAQTTGVQEEIQTAQRLLNIEMLRSSLRRAEHPIDLPYQLQAVEQEIEAIRARGLLTEEVLLEKLREEENIKRQIRLEAENVTIAQLRQNEAIAKAKDDLAEVVRLRQQEAGVITSSPERSAVDKINAQTQAIQNQTDARRQATQMQIQLADMENQFIENRLRTLTMIGNLNVEQGKMSRVETIQQEIALTNQATEAQERNIKSLLGNSNLTVQDRVQLNEKLANLYEQDAQKQIELQTKLTQAIREENERRLQYIKGFFSDVGTASQDLLIAGLNKTSTLQDALKNFKASIVSSFTKNATDMASQWAGKALAPMLGVNFKDGDDTGLSSLFSKMFGNMTGLTKPIPEGMGSAAEKMNLAAQAHQTAAGLLSSAANKLLNAASGPIPQINPTTGSVSAVSGDISPRAGSQYVVPGDTGQKITTTLRNRGWSDAAIQGALNNSITESSLNPNAKGAAGEEGLYQFHPKSHIEPFKLAYGGDKSVEAQTNYMADVVEKTMPSYSKNTDSRTATGQFLHGFEKPADQSEKALDYRFSNNTASASIVQNTSSIKPITVELQKQQDAVTPRSVIYAPEMEDYVPSKTDIKSPTAPVAGDTLEDLKRKDKLRQQDPYLGLGPSGTETPAILRAESAAPIKVDSASVAQGVTQGQQQAATSFRTAVQEGALQGQQSLIQSDLRNSQTVTTNSQQTTDNTTTIKTLDQTIKDWKPGSATQNPVSLTERQTAQGGGNVAGAGTGTGVGASVEGISKTASAASQGLSLFSSATAVASSAALLFGKNLSPTGKAVLGGVSLASNLLSFGTKAASLFAAPATGGLSLAGLFSEQGAVIPSGLFGMKVPEGVQAISPFAAMLSAKDGTVVPSAAGGLHVQETSLSSSIKTGIKNLALNGQSTMFNTSKQISGPGGSLAVNDGKGGRVAVVHPGELIVPAAETKLVLAAIKGNTVVPSAAGGLLLGDTQQGFNNNRVSTIHSPKLAVPDRLSGGVQSAISSAINHNNDNHASSSSVNNSSTINYSPQITGYHPYRSKSDFQSMLRTHGRELVRYAETAVRNGVSPTRSF
jgi:hypothetical protein